MYVFVYVCVLYIILAKHKIIQFLKAPWNNLGVVCKGLNSPTQLNYP